MSLPPKSGVRRVSEPKLIPDQRAPAEPPLSPTPRLGNGRGPPPPSKKNHSNWAEDWGDGVFPSSHIKPEVCSFPVTPVL